MKKWKFKMEIQNLLHGIQLSEYVNGSYSLQNSIRKKWARKWHLNFITLSLLKKFSSGLAAFYDALSVGLFVLCPGCWLSINLWLLSIISPADFRIGHWVGDFNWSYLSSESLMPHYPFTRCLQDDVYMNSVLILICSCKDKLIS